jgi:LPXTG-site transpeptidase (sortase) family protein
MQSKISLKWLLIICSTMGIVFSSIVIFFLTLAMLGQGSYTRSVTLTSNQTSQASSRVPIRLKIPKIHVDAAIESVGLTPQGAMGAPKGPTDTDWFDLGALPGENGTAVIDGHFGWKDGIPAVFDNLSTLQKGDKIYVEDEKGATTTFVVREVRTYGQNENPSDVFVSSDGKAHLNLITCEGVWNSSQKSYSDRLVVFADME